MSNRSANVSAMTSGLPGPGRGREPFRGAMLWVSFVGNVRVGCGRQRPQKIAQPVVVPVTDMVAIKSESFSRQGGQRLTITHNFWLGRFELTQGEYLALMGKNPNHSRTTPPGLWKS